MPEIRIYVIVPKNKNANVAVLKPLKTQTQTTLAGILGKYSRKTNAIPIPVIETITNNSQKFYQGALLSSQV